MHRPLATVLLALGVTACADPVTSPESRTPAPSAAREEVVARAVHVVYLVPADREVNRDYVRALGGAAENLRLWYQEQLGTGQTFGLTQPVVEVIRTGHTASWYAENPTESDYAVQFWFNVLDDAFALTGGEFYDPDDVWVYFVDAQQACGQITGAVASVAVMPLNELRGLAGEPTAHPCTGQVDTWGSCFWVGVFGHELGHALGLPHPASCEPMTVDCPYHALMWRGFEVYPATFLLADEREFLAGSPFLVQTRLRGRTPACGDIAPRAALAGATQGAAARVAGARGPGAGAAATAAACAFDRLRTVVARR